MKENQFRTIEVVLYPQGSIKVSVDQSTITPTSHGETICRKFLMDMGITTNSDVDDYCKHEK